MQVTRQGKMDCHHVWIYYDLANTQYCVVCGRCETPNP